METANIFEQMTFKHRAWRIIPDTKFPNCFSMEKTQTNTVWTNFVLYGSDNMKLLNRIACAPELEDIAEMYQDNSIGKHTEKSVAELPTIKQQWRVIPDEGHPDWFNLEETETATVLATFVLTKEGDPEYLNCIANAPELECIAKTFYTIMALAI
ncbi:MAG: hypothetical protein AAF934_10120 [Bacteroidota bacterium]